MGLIINENTGGGGGDATAANQATQISEFNILLLRQQPTATTSIITLQNATAAGLAAAVQTNLQANTAKVLLNISYVHDTGPTPWHAFITYR